MAKAEESSKPAEVAQPMSFAEQIKTERTMQQEAKAKYRKEFAAKAGTYQVECRGETFKFEARDENEAWAMFCDRIQSWPSRRQANPKIEKVK